MGHCSPDAIWTGVPTRSRRRGGGKIRSEQKTGKRKRGCKRECGGREKKRGTERREQSDQQHGKAAIKQSLRDK